MGALCGSGASFAIAGAMLASYKNSIGMPLVTMVALPVLGAVIGYEVEQAANTRPAISLRRVGLTVGLAGDGRTLLSGVAGSF